MSAGRSTLPRELRDGIECLFDGFETILEHHEQNRNTSLFSRNADPTYEDEYEFGNFNLDLDTTRDAHEVTIHSILYTDDGQRLEFNGDSIGSPPTEHPEILNNAFDEFEEWWETMFDEAYEHTGTLEHARRELDRLQAEQATPDSLSALLNAIEEQDKTAIEQALPDLTDEQQDMVYEWHREEMTTNYEDETLALVTIEFQRSFGTRWFSAVVGRDDTPTGFFVHEVDGETLDHSTQPPLSAIRSAMGFEADLDHDDITSLPKRTPTRAQGDLKLTHLVDYISPDEARAMHDHAEDIRVELQHTFSSHITLQRLFRTTRLFYDARAETVRANVYDSFANHGLVGFLNESTNNTGLNAFDRPYINRNIAAELNEICSNSGLVSSHECEPEPSHDPFEAEAGLTLPVDNHLLRFESAAPYPLTTAEEEPIIVTVPEESTVSITHAEHPEKRLTLEPGLYEVGLLRRGDIPDPFSSPRW